MAQSCEATIKNVQHALDALTGIATETINITFELMPKDMQAALAWADKVHAQATLTKAAIGDAVKTVIGVDWGSSTGSITKEVLLEMIKLMPEVDLGPTEATWMLEDHTPVQKMWELGSPAPIYVKGKPLMTLKPVAPLPLTPNIPSAKAQSDADVTWTEPQIKCPNCGSVINGLADAMEELPAPRPTKFNQLPVPGVTSQNAGPAVLVWRAHPCNCKVSQEWAGAYAKEVQNRKTGGKPGPVQAMTASELEAKKKALEKSISNLLLLKAKYEEQISVAMASKMPGPPVAELSKVERELVLKTHSLMKLCPGKHNCVAPTLLSQDTLAWASKNKLSVPPPIKYKLPQPSLAEITEKIKNQATGYEGQKSVVNPSKVVQPHPTKGPAAPALPPTLQTLPQGPVGPVGHAGVKGEPGLVGPLPYALEFKIQMVDGPGVPKQGDVIVDEKGTPMGRVAHITTATDGAGYMTASITVIPIATGSTGPKAGPVADTAKQPVPPHPSDTVDAQLQLKAKEIQRNIIDHETKGTPLSPEAVLFLKEYGIQFSGSLPADGPLPSSRLSGKVLTRQQLARDRFLSKASRRERPKVKRARKRPGSEGDG